MTSVSLLMRLVNLLDKKDTTVTGDDMDAGNNSCTNISRQTPGKANARLNNAKKSSYCGCNHILCEHSCLQDRGNTLQGKCKVE